MEQDAEYRVRETMLSRKPRKNSAQVAAAVVFVVVGISLLGWRDGGVLLPKLAASRTSLEQQEYWQLATAVAAHSDAEHLFSNILFVALFSYLLYGYFGAWVFPALGVISAVLTNYVCVLTYPEGVSLVGASGMVYWMAGFWLTMYLLIERSVSIGKRFMRAAGIAMVVLLPTTIEANVGYRAHAIGFALGLVAALAYFRWKREAIRASEVIEVETSEAL
jgi:rhomboid protease GluP